MYIYVWKVKKKREKKKEKEKETLQVVEVLVRLLGLWGWWRSTAAEVEMVGMPTSACVKWVERISPKKQTGPAVRDSSTRKPAVSFLDSFIPSSSLPSSSSSSSPSSGLPPDWVFEKKKKKKILLLLLLFPNSGISKFRTLAINLIPFFAGRWESSSIKNNNRGK